MTDDELINRAIDEAIASATETEDELKKRKPKQPSFRYLTDEESKMELNKETVERVSVMTTPETPKVTVDDIFVLGMGGDMPKIEDIVRRHQESRKFREK
jgi:hypothetical protein